MSRQFLMFLMTGGIAALVNFGSRILYSHWLSFSYAIVLAYLTGMITAFLLARSLVFKQNQQSTKRSIIYFSIVNMFAIFQTWGVTLLMADFVLPLIGVAKFVNEIAHMIGIVVPVFSSYAGHKHFTFKGKS